MAIAAGKTNASRVKVGDRILVKVYTRDNEADVTMLDHLKKDWALGIATTKTGTGVTVARVLSVEAATETGGRRDRRVYDIVTSEGTLGNNAAHQTMILAPEDAAGIKRARVEAMALDAVYTAYPVTEEPAVTDTWPAERAADTVARVAAGEPYIGDDAQAIVDGLLAEADPLDALAFTELTDAEVEEELAALKLEAEQDAAEYQVSPGSGHAEARAVRDHVDGLKLELGVSLDMGHATAQTLQEARSAAAALSGYQETMAAVDAAQDAVLAGPGWWRGDAGHAALEDPARVERVSESLVRIVRDPEARVAEGDVVRIHRGTRLYRVVQVEHDLARDNTRPDATWEDMSMARLVPCDPENDHQPGWVSLDLLHRVPPVARVTTVMVQEYQELADDLVAVAGTGWESGRGVLRQPGLVSAPGSRPPYGVLLAAGLDHTEESLVHPVGCLRIGDAIVINGRCFTVTWDGGPAEPHLEPTRWRDR